LKVIKAIIIIRVLTNIDMTREISTQWIFAHSNVNKVVFVEKSGFSLG